MANNGCCCSRSVLAVTLFCFALSATVLCSGALAQEPLGGSKDDAGDGFQAASADSIINLIQWPAASGGNDHWYAVLAQTHTWHEADSIAQTLSHGGMTGYLATITTGTENTFILDSVISNTSQPNIEDQFYLGGEKIGDVWVWSNGEVFCMENWAPGEPNHLNEDVLSMWGHGLINDPPGTWNNTLRTDEANPHAHFWSVIEWGDPVPQTTVCGDEITDCDEECDGEPWCQPDCTEVCDCGDGYVTCDEECDGEPWCQPDCTIACDCGDGYVTCGEECDGEPWCQPDCTIACECGDGYVTCEEECDGEPWCQPDCTIACDCGDGYVTCGEECDGGPLCLPDCTLDCDGTTVGDVSGDGVINSADIITVLWYVFKGGYLECWPMADVNASHSITSSDIIYLVDYVFRGGPPPAAACEVANLWGGLCE